MCPSGIFMTVVVSEQNINYFSIGYRIVLLVCLSRRFAEVMYELDTDI